MLLYAGGTVTGAKISAGGKEAIAAGVTVSSLSIGSGVTLTVSSGGTASKPTVLAGGTVADLGHTLSATVRGMEIVSARGVASSTTVDKGGTLRVNSSGTAAATVLSGGTETVSSGGKIVGAVTYKGTGGTLSVAGKTGIVFSVSGFAKGDAIDLANFAFKGAKLSFVENKAKTRGVLTITDGALKARITLFGQYVATGFKLSAAGGGTAITYTSATAHAELAGSHT
jgi:autotransporter passenger strand-loop-strand repeat protein